MSETKSKPPKCRSCCTLGSAALYNGRTFHVSYYWTQFQFGAIITLRMFWESFVFVELLLMLITGIAYGRIGKG